MSYIDHLKLDRQLAPSTIIDKIRHLHQAVDYTTLKLNVGPHSPPQRKCECANLWLRKWAWSMSKDAFKQWLKQSMKSEEEIINAENPYEFWENQDVKLKVVEAVNSKKIQADNYTLVISYLAANVIYSNAQ